MVLELSHNFPFGFHKFKCFVLFSINFRRNLFWSLPLNFSVALNINLKPLNSKPNPKLDMNDLKYILIWYG